MTLLARARLTANASYYLVSQKVSGGAQWCDYTTTAKHTSVATAPKAVFVNGSTYAEYGGAQNATFRWVFSMDDSRLPNQYL